MLSKLEEAGPVVYCEGSVFRFSSVTGIYQPVPDADQSCIVQGFAGCTRSDGKTVKLKASDVRGAVALAHDRIEDVSFFTQAPPGLAFANGFVRVTAEGVTLSDHAPEHRARIAYPFPFERGAAPMRWLSFLYSVFRDDADREERIALVHEFFGGALLGVATRFDQCIAMQGNGDDGKSTLLDIGTAAMPPGSCVSVPPHKLSGTASECDYFRAELVGKLLNVVGELPEAELLESTGFKAMVNGDAVSARHPSRPAFTFRPRAAHVFAANKLPAVSDQTPGFWRRFIVLGFTRCFTGDPDRDPMIGEAIIATELPAIVGMMLDGARRLLAQGAYTLPASHAAALRSWQLRADPVRQFVEERTEPCDVGVGAASADLYEAYRRWGTTAGHTKLLARNSFGERMGLAGFPSKHTRDGSRYPVQLRPHATPPRESRE